MEKEAKARININRLLEEQGLGLIDNNKGKANVIIEPNIETKDLDDNFEKIKKAYQLEVSFVQVADLIVSVIKVLISF